MRQIKTILYMRGKAAFYNSYRQLEVVMDLEKQRKWREIAEQASREQDSGKLLALTQQLAQLLEENGSGPKDETSHAA
jgi:hypothetical protein